MDKVLDELDNQEMHLRRLARRVDAFKPTGSDVELQISRMLHLSFEAIYASWTDVGEAPPGWPGATTMLMERLRAQLEAIEMMARVVEDLGANIEVAEIRRGLQQGRERMPAAMEVRVHKTPVLMTPGMIERDFYELIFNAQQEALLKIDGALDALE